VYRALFTAARAPPVALAPVPVPVPAPAPVPEPEVVTSAGGEEEEPMDTGSSTSTPSAPTPVAVPIPQAAAPVPPAPPAPAPHASTGSAPTPQHPQVVPEMGWTSRNKFIEADEDAHYHTKECPTMLLARVQHPVTTPMPVTAAERWDTMHISAPRSRIHQPSKTRTTIRGLLDLRSLEE